MSDQNRGYPIVVGIDFSELGLIALEQAFEIAEATPGTETHVVHVAGAFGPLVRLEVGTDIKTVSLEEASLYLATYVGERLEGYERSRQAALARPVTHLRVGPAAHELRTVAREVGAELIVLGTHGRRGLSRLLLGSVAEEVLRHAECPVLIARRSNQQSGGEAGSEMRL